MKRSRFRKFKFSLKSQVLESVIVAENIPRKPVCRLFDLDLRLEWVSLKTKSEQNRFVMVTKPGMAFHRCEFARAQRIFLFGETSLDRVGKRTLRLHHQCECKYGPSVRGLKRRLWDNIDTEKACHQCVSYGHAVPCELF